MAYAIAKLGYDAEQLDRGVDFDGIWLAQTVPENLKRALTLGSKSAHDIIVNPGGHAKRHGMGETAGRLEWCVLSRLSGQISFLTS